MFKKIIMDQEKETWRFKSIYAHSGIGFSNGYLSVDLYYGTKDKKRKSVEMSARFPEDAERSVVVNVLKELIAEIETIDPECK
jgi:hypothetical protein